MDMLRSIEAAATSAKKVKVSSERLEQLEKALEEPRSPSGRCQGAAPSSGDGGGEREIKRAPIDVECRGHRFETHSDT